MRSRGCTKGKVPMDLLNVFLHGLCPFVDSLKRAAVSFEDSDSDFVVGYDGGISGDVVRDLV